VKWTIIISVEYVKHVFYSIPPSLDFRKPPGTTQRPLNMSLAISCLVYRAKAQVNLLKGLLKRGKGTFFILSKNSHWALGLTWASECTRRYPTDQPKHTKKKRDLKNWTSKDTTTIVYRRGSTLLGLQYPFRCTYNY